MFSLHSEPAKNRPRECESTEADVASEKKMSNKPFYYQDPFPLKKDETEYYLLSRDHVSVAEFEGQEILKVEPQSLTLLAQHAFN